MKGNGSYYFGDLGLDGKVIIIWIFKKQGVRRRGGYTCVWLMGYGGSVVKMAVILLCFVKEFLGKRLVERVAILC